MERSGALFAVAQQAAVSRAAIEEAWQEGRRGTRRAQEVFWTAMASDGMLPAGADVEWLIDTSAVLGAAETYLLVDPAVRLGPGPVRAVARRHLDPAGRRVRHPGQAGLGPRRCLPRPNYRPVSHLVIVVTSSVRPGQRHRGRSADHPADQHHQQGDRTRTIASASPAASTPRAFGSQAATSRSAAGLMRIRPDGPRDDRSVRLPRPGGRAHPVTGRVVAAALAGHRSAPRIGFFFHLSTSRT